MVFCTAGLTDVFRQASLDTCRNYRLDFFTFWCHFSLEASILVLIHEIVYHCSQSLSNFLLTKKKQVVVMLLVKSCWQPLLGYIFNQQFIVLHGKDHGGLSKNNSFTLQSLPMSYLINSLFGKLAEFFAD